MKRDSWTFISNHGHVLACLTADSEVLIRDVAASAGITERAVQQIIGDLERAGVVARVRVGRRNHYLVGRGQRLRHPLESAMTIGQFVDLMHPPAADTQARSPVQLITTGSSGAEPVERREAGEWTRAASEAIAHLRSQA